MPLRLPPLDPLPVPEAGVADPYAAEYSTTLQAVRTGRPGALAAMEALAFNRSPNAVVFIADAARRGSYYEPELERAESWYLVAADEGSARALYGLGATYYEQRQYDLAVVTLEAAAQKHSGAAIRRLGWMYFRGQGVAADRVKALALWRRSADLGYVWAKRSLAWALFAGGLSDKVRAAAVFSSALFDAGVIVAKDQYDRVFD